MYMYMYVPELAGEQEIQMDLRKSVEVKTILSKSQMFNSSYQTITMQCSLYKNYKRKQS